MGWTRTVLSRAPATTPEYYMKSHSFLAEPWLFSREECSANLHSMGVETIATNIYDLLLCRVYKMNISSAAVFTPVRKL